MRAAPSKRKLQERNDRERGEVGQHGLHAHHRVHLRSPFYIHTAYLIFVTGTTGGACVKKSYVIIKDTYIYARSTIFLCYLTQMNIALFICQHPSHVFGGELLEQMASLTQICYRNVNIVQSEVKDYIICTYDKRDMGNVNSNQMDPHCQLNLQTVCRL